jgi:hypothetical protein
VVNGQQAEGEEGVAALDKNEMCEVAVKRVAEAEGEGADRAIMETVERIIVDGVTEVESRRTASTKATLVLAG